MKKFSWLVCSLVASLLVSIASAQQVQVMYAATGAGGVAGTLYTFAVDAGGTPLNQTTTTPVAITNASGGGAIGITGLAVSPITGVLYGVTTQPTSGTGVQNTVSSSLVTINPLTGVATVIGAVGHTVADISFNSTGTLYAWQGGGSPTTVSRSLYTLNLMTGGVATTVGSTSLPFTAGGGLAFSPSGTLYVTPMGSTGGELDTLTLSPFSRNKAGDISGADFLGFGAMAFNSQGVLFGADNNGTQSSTTVDVELDTIALNGAVGFVFDLPTSTDAIAFATIPEPSTVALLVFGVGVSVALALRRRS